MLDGLTQPMAFPHQLPNLDLLPRLTDPFLSSKPSSPATYDQPQAVDALVKRCEDSLRRLSTLTNSFPVTPMSTITIVPYNPSNFLEDVKKPAVNITVTEVAVEDSPKLAPVNPKKTKASTNGRKFKVCKSRPAAPSRTNSGLSKKSLQIDGSEELKSRNSTDIQPRSTVSSATSYCDIVRNPSTSPKKTFIPLNEYLYNSPVKPDDSNICNLLTSGISRADEVLTQSCINHLRQGAVYHPLITIKACAPYACERPTIPSAITAQIRPILHEAVRTLLDDYPDYDCGEPSPRWTEYHNSVPVQLQTLFAQEWCRYVKRIKSFHENSPWDDFDYDHNQNCPHKDTCELYTRIHVRDAWNQFWRESILSGNRCVPKPSQVAQFLCTWGSDLSKDKPSHANQPNIHCVAGFKEELGETLECLGGDNARYNWRWLGENLFKQRR